MINLREQFKEHFGTYPQVVVSAPGRVNLIGEHTDYNEGFVLPIAIDRRIWVAGRTRDDGEIRLRSLNQELEVGFSIHEPLVKMRNWGDYPKGVVAQLRKRVISLTGWEALYYGNVPVASGLSSSAAMEVVTLTLLQNLFHFHLSDIEKLHVCHQAEVEFVGVNCGVMDQFISLLGKKDHALFLDCRTLEYSHIPLKLEGYKIVICNSRVKRGLVDSKYNRRRAECEQGVAMLARKLENVRSLRDVTLEQLEAQQKELSDVVYRRCRHVVSENERVVQAIKTLKQGNLLHFGQLLNQSHQSLRDDYEVSCPELDLLVETAQGIKGVLGSRLTGAGFGGCTISLVAEEVIEEFEHQVATKYEKAFGIKPEIYITQAQNGARQEE